MRILSNDFCQHWQDKILNVHPSLLPKYAGGMDTNVHEQVLINDNKEYLKHEDVKDDNIYVCHAFRKEAKQ